MHFVKIGNVKLKRTAVLAPMTFFADTAHRLICRKFGASLVYSEMVSVEKICSDFKLVEKKLKMLADERPMAIQIFGSEPKLFKFAMPKILEQKPDIIDINMECPEDLVTSKNAGCALMKNLKLAEEIARTVVLNSNVPVTVKINKGWSENSINAVEFAKIMQNCNVSAIAVHGRTKSQMFSGQADWKIVKEVKKAVSIPVILNGDVKSAEDVKRAYEETGADLVMIGRGSFGRPFLFKQVEDFLKTGIYETPTISEVVDLMLEHMKKIEELEEENMAARKMKAQAIKYFNGFKNSAKIRSLCSKISCFNDVLKIAIYVKNECIKN